MVFAYVGMGMALHAIIFPLKWARSVGLGEGRPSRHYLPTAHIIYHISYCLSQSHFERQRHGLRTYTNSELEIKVVGGQQGTRGATRLAYAHKESAMWKGIRFQGRSKTSRLVGSLQGERKIE